MQKYGVLLQIKSYLKPPCFFLKIWLWEPKNLTTFLKNFLKTWKNRQTLRFKKNHRLSKNVNFLIYWGIAKLFLRTLEKSHLITVKFLKIFASLRWIFGSFFDLCRGLKGSQKSTFWQNFSKIFEKVKKSFKNFSKFREFQL